MKKVFLVFIISLAMVVIARSQNYFKFKLGFGAGPAFGAAGDGGILFALEPAYHLRDDLVIGLRLEFADTHLDLPDGGYQIGSYTLNGQYYFGTSKLRPLVGAGLGLFNVTSQEFPPNVEEGKKLGFYPRVGFDVGHFFLALEYNLIPPSESIYLDKINNNYFGFRIGFFAGGNKMVSGGGVK